MVGKELIFVDSMPRSVVLMKPKPNSSKSSKDIRSILSDVAGIFPNVRARVTNYPGQTVSIGEEAKNLSAGSRKIWSALSEFSGKHAVPIKTFISIGIESKS